MEILDVEQGSLEWHEARVGVPTASEFSRIVTPKTGALSTQSSGYIADLIVECVEGIPEAIDSYYMMRGRYMEDDARDWYEFKYETEVEQVGFIRNEGFGWSPDGLINCKQAGVESVQFRSKEFYDLVTKTLDGSGAIEIKCPKPSTHVKWLLDGGLPDEHRPQCHAALIIGELDWLDFVSYSPGFRPLVVRVEPDDYTKKVRKAMAQFLDRYAEARTRVLEC